MMTHRLFYYSPLLYIVTVEYLHAASLDHFVDGPQGWSRCLTPPVVHPYKVTYLLETNQDCGNAVYLIGISVGGFISKTAK